MAKLEADVRGKQKKGKYEDVQKVFCISYASDVALHSVASPAAFLGFSELNLKLSGVSSFKESWSIPSLLFPLLFFSAGRGDRKNISQKALLPGM